MLITSGDEMVRGLPTYQLLFFEIYLLMCSYFHPCFSPLPQRVSWPVQQQVLINEQAFPKQPGCPGQEEDQRLFSSSHVQCLPLQHLQKCHRKLNWKQILKKMVRKYIQTTIKPWGNMPSSWSINYFLTL